MRSIQYVFILALVVLVASCQEEDIKKVECASAVRATVKDLTGLDGCGFVFELEDGTRLEPLRLMYCGTPPLPKEVTEDPLYNFEFVNGKEVMIGYEVCNDCFSVCMVGPVVKITCMAEVDTSTSQE